MNSFQIAWRSIQQRGLASFLTTLSMALGVMLVVAVLSRLLLVNRAYHDKITSVCTCHQRKCRVGISRAIAKESNKESNGINGRIPQRKQA